MTNSNLKARVRAYMQDHEVNYTTALRAIRTLPDLPTGPIAYVRETWPIPDRSSVWDGDFIQVVVDCPLCPEGHQHGGRISDGRNLGHRVSHCHHPHRSDSDDGYTIYDARPRRTVSQNPHTHFRFDGDWPGDPEPTVDTIVSLIEAEDRLAAIQFLRDHQDLPPVTIRSAWEAGLGWEGEHATAACHVIVSHPRTPKDVVQDAFDGIQEADDPDDIIALASSPAMRYSNLANRLVDRHCQHFDPSHSVAKALAANPATTTDTLGWLSEHATGFLHGEADVDLSRLILGHSNADDEVWGFFTDRLDTCGRVVLKSDRCDTTTAMRVFEVAAETDDGDLIVQASRFLVKTERGIKYLTGWVDDASDEYADGYYDWALDVVRPILGDTLVTR